MKNLILSLLLLSPAAWANDQQAGFEELKNVAGRTSEIFSDDSKCSFRSETTADGLRMVINVNMDDMVIVDVQPQDLITVNESQEFDGSYQYVYNIKDKGRLVVTHADDAMDRVELSDGSYNVNCQIDL